MHTKKEFEVIVADPPWSFKDSLTMSDVARGAAANYAVMSNKDIEQLPIQQLINPSGAILALWVPSSLLQEGLNTMKAWGFQHKQTYIWVKIKKTPFRSLVKKAVASWVKDLSLKKLLLNNFSQFSWNDILSFGMGRLFRQTHEICLIGINNNGIYKKLANKSQRSVSFGENLKHSAKPEHLQDSLEMMFPNCNYLELFARRVRPNWTCLGNEIDGKDIFDAIAEL